MAKTTATPIQQELFTIEGNLANRTAIREISTNATWLYKVNLSYIRIRPDRFNARIKPEGMSEEMWEQILMIPDLADKIWVNNGPADPILGDFHSDGHFYINDGERRTRGLKHLIDTGRDKYPNGESVSEVLVLMNPPGTTDLQRKKKMYNTNDTMPFTPMQKAHYFLSLTLPPYNLSHDEIADSWMPAISRQTVDNYIMAATELPQATQDAIDTGEIKMTNALADHRKGKAEKRKGKNPAGTEDEPIITGALADTLDKKEKHKEKLRGDEDEFDQDDNTKGFAGSKGGPKEDRKEDRSSGSHSIGKDAIYMRQQKEALFKVFFNRYNVLFEISRKLIVADKPEDEEDEERAPILFQKRHEHTIEKMMGEYDITVK